MVGRSSVAVALCLLARLGSSQVPTPRPTLAPQGGGGSPAPTPSLSLTLQPTFLQHFNDLQVISATGISDLPFGTFAYLSRCPLVACPEGSQENANTCEDPYCLDGQYLLAGDAVYQKMLIYQRTDLNGQYEPLLSAAADSALDSRYHAPNPDLEPPKVDQPVQQLNWTCASTDRLAVNLTIQGDASMFIQSSGGAAGHYLAIGAPGVGEKGTVNIYRKSAVVTQGDSFVFLQQLRPVPSAEPAPVGASSFPVVIGSGLALGQFALAAGTNNNYIYTFDQSSDTGRYTPVLEANGGVLCACNCLNGQPNGGQPQTTPSACDKVAMSQTASVLVVADGTSTQSNPSLSGVLVVYLNAGEPGQANWQLGGSVSIGGPATGDCKIPTQKAAAAQCTFGQSIAMTTSGDVVAVSASCASGLGVSGFIYTFLSTAGPGTGPSSSSSTTGSPYKCSSLVLFDKAYTSADGPSAFGFSLSLISERSGYYLMQGNPAYGINKGNVKVYWSPNPFSEPNSDDAGHNLWTTSEDGQTGNKQGYRLGYAVAGTRGMMAITCPLCTRGTTASEEDRLPYGNVRLYSNEAPTGVPTGQPTHKPSQFVWPTMQPTIFKDFVVDVVGEPVGNEYVAAWTFSDLEQGGDKTWYLSIQVLVVVVVPLFCVLSLFVCFLSCLSSFLFFSW